MSFFVNQVRVQWPNGDQAIMHILVIHAIVILLTYGPHSCIDLFNELMSIWFAEQLPLAFLVDTSEEALLFPDWLKLRMIRSTVPRLVDAAVKVDFSVAFFFSIFLLRSIFRHFFFLLLM